MLVASALFVASVVMNAVNANMVILFFILVIFWFVEIKNAYAEVLLSHYRNTR